MKPYDIVIRPRSKERALYLLEENKIEFHYLFYTNHHLNKNAKKLPENFSYNSYNNKHYLTINEIRKIIKNNY